MGTQSVAVDTVTPPPDEAAVKAVTVDLGQMEAKLRKDKCTFRAGTFRDIAAMLDDTYRYWRYNVNDHKVVTNDPDAKAIFEKHGLGDMICAISHRKFQPQAKQ